MPVSVEQRQLEHEVADLRAQLAASRERAARTEQQLERYAGDLRETFKAEHARAEQLRDSYHATVRALSNAVEARDAYTGKHAERVAAYGLEIASAAGLALAEDPQIEFGFLLHDVGKVAIPDAILFKPEPLTSEERRLIERHPVIGVEILREIEFLGAAKDVVRSHHERWDGRGYPDGLAAEEIPIAARVFSVADTLDALTTTRPYRSGVSLAKARQEIAAHAGTQFDPTILEAFARVPDERLRTIRREIG